MASTSGSGKHVLVIQYYSFASYVQGVENWSQVVMVEAVAGWTLLTGVTMEAYLCLVLK